MTNNAFITSIEKNLAVRSDVVRVMRDLQEREPDLSNTEMLEMAYTLSDSLNDGSVVWDGDDLVSQDGLRNQEFEAMLNALDAMRWLDDFRNSVDFQESGVDAAKLDAAFSSIEKAYKYSQKTWLLRHVLVS